MAEPDTSPLEQLRAALDARESQLAAEIKSVSEDGRDLPGPADSQREVADFGEQGEQRLRTDMRRAERDRDVNELREIVAAKERMVRGVYGQCIDCGVDIPFARLQVQPASARCVPCQENYEKLRPTVLRVFQAP